MEGGQRRRAVERASGDTEPVGQQGELIRRSRICLWLPRRGHTLTFAATSPTHPLQAADDFLATPSPPGPSLAPTLAGGGHNHWKRVSGPRRPCGPLRPTSGEAPPVPPRWTGQPRDPHYDPEASGRAGWGEATFPSRHSGACSPSLPTSGHWDERKPLSPEKTRRKQTKFSACFGSDESQFR